MEQGPPKIPTDGKDNKVERKHGPARPFTIPKMPFSDLSKPKSSSNPEFEGFKEKFSRKVKENPVVPLGLVVTIGVLSTGFYSFLKGDRELSQKMMRYRVMAQGITLFAVLGGVWKQSLQAAKVQDTDKDKK